MHNMVIHAIIPFDVGGAVDMYPFPNALEGTALVTFELIGPDGTGPLPNDFGTYELLAFTRHKIDEDETSPFNLTERRLCGIFTRIGNYCTGAVLKPNDTIEIPGGENEPNKCLVLHEWDAQNTRFSIDGKPHGLLLLLEVFRSEMDFARANGTPELVNLLKKEGHYPFSDLDRRPVR
ncbi:hypothetical protein EHQ53_12250 [Leptospira langatensis]|uniref:Suppressor of fused-like domain-containing protein n=2 Tax=Leptospira langatensis TaxID=2484983 RepID=A0A5F1ZUC1_9LEPT|nr:hypothetical protein EHO57_14255 [Leptospira langatensis]TGL40776.1 hypothetical protein EHQ53_12250 [Leptospira langatensis]